MSNEISFPTGPFYIQSKIGHSNWALTPDSVGNFLRLTPLKGGPEHLWEATPDNRGGSHLKHTLTCKYLTTTMEMTPVGLGGTVKVPAPAGFTMAPLDPANGLQLFRIEDLGAPWVGINLLEYWQSKMNVIESDVQGIVAPFNWCDGQDNEEWLVFPETSAITTESIAYDLEQAKPNLNLPPTVSDQSIQDNQTGSVPLTGSISLNLSTTTSRSITNSTSDTKGQVFTQTFGSKGGIDKVFEVSASASFSESSSSTIGYSDTTVDSKTTSQTTQVNVNVPPGKKYQYTILVFNGQCSIPYTAHLLFQSVVPGAAPYRFVSTGIYTGVNAIRSEVSVTDVTQGPATGTPVERHPLPVNIGK